MESAALKANGDGEDVDGNDRGDQAAQSLVVDAVASQHTPALHKGRERSHRERNPRM